MQDKNLEGIFQPNWILLSKSGSENNESTHPRKQNCIVVEPIGFELLEIWV